MIKMTTPNTSELMQLLRSEIKDALGNVDQFVTVGIHEDENSREEGVMTNAQIGAINHFGNDRIPARPWLDVGVKSGNAEYIKQIEAAAKNNEPLDLALERCGLLAVGFTQQYITELSTPPNAPYTIKKKGSANVLIDTGQMRQSVTYQTTNIKPKEGIG